MVKKILMVNKSGGFYNTTEDFLKFDKVFKAAAVKAIKGKTTYN